MIGCSCSLVYTPLKNFSLNWYLCDDVLLVGWCGSFLTPMGWSCSIGKWEHALASWGCSTLGDELDLFCHLGFVVICWII